MTIVTIYQKDNHYRLQATGHATGFEDACSGISSLVTALAGYLYNSDAQINEIILDPGNAVIDFTGDSSCKAAFDMAVIGLKQIELILPDAIKVE